MQKVYRREAGTWVDAWESALNFSEKLWSTRICIEKHNLKIPALCLECKNCHRQQHEKFINFMQIMQQITRKQIFSSKCFSGYWTDMKWKVAQSFSPSKVTPNGKQIRALQIGNFVSFPKQSEITNFLSRKWGCGEMTPPECYLCLLCGLELIAKTFLEANYYHAINSITSINSQINSLPEASIYLNLFGETNPRKPKNGNEQCSYIMQIEI